MGFIYRSKSGFTWTYSNYYRHSIAVFFMLFFWFKVEMVVHTRLDCVIGSSALMRLCAQLAYHHVTRRPERNRICCKQMLWDFSDFSGGKNLAISRHIAKMIVNIWKKYHPGSWTITLLENVQIPKNGNLFKKRAYHKFEQKRPWMDMFFRAMKLSKFKRSQ